LDPKSIISFKNLNEKLITHFSISVLLKKAFTKLFIITQRDKKFINILVLDTHIPNDFITIKINQDNYVGIQRQKKKKHMQNMHNNLKLIIKDKDAT